MTHPGMKQADHGERIVYIRTVPVSELPPEAQARTGGADVYAIHDETGARLALVADRTVAFIVARQNDMTPVSVH